MPTLSEARGHMERALDALRREFGTVRTGKATPALLEMVRVEAYGSQMPLNQVGTVSVPEPRLLVVQPWDKSLIGAIEKAIRTSDLGLNPSNDGNVIRIPVPPLTEERRREMVKVLHKLAEEGRISVRHARQEANKRIKAAQQQHEISEDDAHRQLEEIQKLTDDYIARIDQLLHAKEQEVMEV
ncbi:MAG TPA: ribosome recycling factor [Thermomicrobiales bacterium]|nr:ribosome recycling factor [Thermomicrobiales bacterium]